MMGPTKLNSQQELLPTNQTWSKKDLMRYDKKLNSMKKYAPFLDKVVQKLEKNKIKVRTRHLSAAKAFQSLLSESTIRIRLENLLKLEKLLKGLFKNKHKLKIITRSEKTKIINRRKARLIARTQIPIAKKDSSNETILCPICKGRKKFRDVDSCFACNGVGKLTETFAEKWWHILHQIKCNPSSTSAINNWPKSVTIDSLPTTWKGDTSDTTFALSRQEFWDEKFREQKILNPDKQHQNSTKIISLILCPVCRGFRIILDDQKCFACEGDGKLQEKIGEEWWEILCNVRCNSNTSTKWPNSVNINCLPTVWKGNAVEVSVAGLRQEFWDQKLKEFKKNNNVKDFSSKKEVTKSSSTSFLCAVCKGCKKIRSGDTCFACNGDGKVDEKNAEEWWEVMCNIRCNMSTSKLSKKWPQSTKISELPSIWKGNAKEIEISKKRCEFWEEKIKETQKRNREQNQTAPGESQKRKRVNKKTNLVNRNNIEPNIGTETGISNLQTRIWLPMVYQPPNSNLESAILPKWPTKNNVNFTKPMDTVLPSDESDLHLCPICRGNSNLSNFRICLACNGCRRLNRASASNWWQRVMRNLSDIEFSHDERALPYNLSARQLPMEWVGTPEQIKAAKEAEVYWRQVKNQWHWQAKLKTPLIKDPPPLTVANVSLQPSAEQHLVGLFPNPSSVFSTVAAGLSNETQISRRVFNMSRCGTNECFDIDTKNPQSSQFTPRNSLLGAPPQIHNSQIEDFSEIDEEPPRNDQILLCSFCRGNRVVKTRPCPACLGQGMLTRMVAQKWWERLYDFRTYFALYRGLGERLALPDGLKWVDLPKEWCGEGSMLRSSVRLGEEWEVRIRDVNKKHRQEVKNLKRGAVQVD